MIKMLDNTDPIYFIWDIILDETTNKEIDQARINSAYKNEIRNLLDQNRSISADLSNKLKEDITRVVKESPASAAMKAGFQAMTFSDSLEDTLIDKGLYKQSGGKKSAEYLIGIKLADSIFGTEGFNDIMSTYSFYS